MLGGGRRSGPALDSRRKPPPGQTREQALPAIAERIAERAAAEAKGELGVLLTSAFILATMHVNATVAQAIFNKVKAMKTLEGYQFILDEGAVDHMRQWILKVGRKKIGEPTEKEQNRINTIEDLARLERVAETVFTATSWDELLRTQ